MVRLFKDYGLSIALATLFFVTWLVQTVTGWVHFASEQQQHGETAQVFGSSGYFWQWMQSTMETMSRTRVASATTYR